MHIGIDFGTCFTSAAVLVGNQFHFVKDAGGENPLNYFPSAAFLDEEGNLLLGEMARKRAPRNPGRFRQEFKRDFGSDTPFRFGETDFSPEEVVASFLRALKEQAEEELNFLLPAAVLTVPATYDAYRRELMLRAAVRAGFREDGVVLLSEPEAVASYFEWQRVQKGNRLPDGSVVLVYDLGGGTFDAALLRKEEGRFRLLGDPVGDPLCGGIDFDREILEAIVTGGSEELREGMDIANKTIPARRMRLEVSRLCREVKHALTMSDSYTAMLPTYEDFTMPRKQFEARIQPYIAKTLGLCEGLLEGASVRWDEVHGVLLTGGSSRVPLVSASVAKWGRPIWRVDDPELGICKGAAVRAGYRRHLVSGVAETVCINRAVIASASHDKTIRLWDAQTGECLKTLTGHADLVYSTSFSPDGKLLASGSGDNTIKLWDTQTGECLKTLTGHSGNVWVVSFSPDGKRIVSGAEDLTVKLWDTQTGECLQTLTGHSSAVVSVLFAPGGHRIVAEGTGLPDAFLNLTDGHSAPVRALAASASRDAFVSGSNDETIRFWAVEESMELDVFRPKNGSLVSLALSSTEDTLVAADRNLGFWSLNQKEADDTRLTPRFGPRTAINAVAISSDGAFVATAHPEALVCIWDARTRRLLHALAGHEDSVVSVAFSPDGSILVSGDTTGTVLHWNFSDRTLRHSVQEHAGSVHALAFAPDGKTLASAGEDGLVCLRDMVAERRLHLLEAHTGGVRGVAFTEEGSALASCGSDGTIRVWNVPTGDLLQTLTGHEGAVNAVLFAQDDDRLISAGDDNSVRFWNLKWA